MGFARKITAAAIIGAVFVALLGLGAPVASARTDVEMTQQQAGKEYLSAVCTANEAIDRYNKRLLRGRDSITFNEIRRRLPELRRLSLALSRAIAKTARALLKPPAAWPYFVADTVRFLANSNLRESRLLSRAGHAGNALRWDNLTQRAYDEARAGLRASQKVRAKLDLPLDVLYF